MIQNQGKSIPEYDLTADGKATDFVLRSTEEIEIRNGGKQDVPHRHNYYTVLFVKSGTGRHVIDYTEYLMHDSSLFFVSPGQVHQVLAEPKMEGFVVLFTKNFLVQHQISESLITNIGLFSNIYNIPPIQVCHTSLFKLESILTEIERAYKSKEAYSLEAISAWLKLFFIECNRYASHLPDDAVLASPVTKDVVKDFKLLLEKHFMNWHKVSDYASKLNVSPDYLNSLIKASIGKTAKEFIQNRIILEAKRLGVHTSLTSKEIAFQIGFEDPAHFSKFFKTVTNRSFSDFRSELAEMIM